MSYTPSLQELNLAEDMNAIIKFKQFRKVERLCKKIDISITEITEILSTIREDDSLLRQKLEYGKGGTSDVRNGLDEIRRVYATHTYSHTTPHIYWLEYQR